MRAGGEIKYTKKKLKIKYGEKTIIRGGHDDMREAWAISMVSQNGSYF